MKSAGAHCFVTQETEHTFIEAERFGEVVFLTTTDVNNTKGSLHNEELFRSIKAQLREFNPEVDYIVPAGSPYVVAGVFLILGNMGLKNIKVLRWNNRDYNYTPLHMDLKRS
ncbi:MAG: hypothetical protein COY40_06520 [Alphaproteobacteria bacterium CG_4_10_14_0_8_um_filter_53_9]|nr:MAG: hypothetical protein COY40_06520 [Alphaproteobacteria bacterium CG_4_10_14_0_8_um_filter_53_9]